jgi:hypothetical protein
VPADGIRLPFFLEAETSERRRFWAALSQANLLDDASTYNGYGVQERAGKEIFG